MIDTYFPFFLFSRTNLGCVHRAVNYALGYDHLVAVMHISICFCHSLNTFNIIMSAVKTFDFDT